MTNTYKVTLSCIVKAEDKTEASVKALHLMSNPENWNTITTVTEEVPVEDDYIDFEV